MKLNFKLKQQDNGTRGSSDTIASRISTLQRILKDEDLDKVAQGNLVNFANALYNHTIFHSSPPLAQIASTRKEGHALECPLERKDVYQSDGRIIQAIRMQSEMFILFQPNKHFIPFSHQWYSLFTV